MIFNNKDYREILKEEFSKRHKKNPTYSLRAFARDLKLPASRLSEAINARRGLSRKSATKIACSIGYSEKETEYFCDLVESIHGRSVLIRSKAKENIYKINSNPHFSTLQFDTFKIIADWYHYAILELTYLIDFQSDSSFISRRLGISKIDAELAIERLIRVGLLKNEKDTLKATEDFTASASGVPSESLKKFHTQILDKAKKALFLQSVQERDFSSITISMNSEKIPEAKALIKNFRRGFGEKLNQDTKKDRVYCLAIQFFRLDEKRSTSV